MRFVPILSASSLGVLIAIGLYTFVYAKGFAYLTNDPAACANCHVMDNHYRAWLQSSHHAVAVCNDCHTPPGLVPKYVTKAINGFNHSLAFTTGRFPEPLRMTARNVEATEKACRKCHHDIVDAIEAGAELASKGRGGRLSCIRCHSTVGHLE